MENLMPDLDASNSVVVEGGCCRRGRSQGSRLTLLNMAAQRLGDTTSIVEPRRFPFSNFFFYLVVVLKPLDIGES